MIQVTFLRVPRATLASASSMIVRRDNGRDELRKSPRTCTLRITIKKWLLGAFRGEAAWLIYLPALQSTLSSRQSRSWTGDS